MATLKAGWQEGKSLKECNQYMLTNSVSTDVTFMVGENRKQVLAHKYVLGSRSSVFYAMLFGPMAESGATIIIPDIESDIFQEILRYLYSEELTVNENNVTSLIQAANKYNITDICNKCMEFLSSCITAVSSCTALDIARLVDECELKDKCLQFIYQNFRDVMQSSSFCTLSKDSLKLIIQSDELDADESLVFEAAKKWGEYQCRSQGNDVNDLNVRNALGDLIQLIRFPIMGMEYFTKYVSKGNILTEQEKVDAQQNETTQNEKLTFISNDRKRKQKLLQLVCMRTSSPYVYSWIQTDTSYSVDFIVSEKVKILGFVMCGDGNPEIYNIEAGLLKYPEALDTIKTKITKSEHQRTFNIMLKDGVCVDKDVIYTAWVKMIGTHTNVSQKCLSSETIDGVEFRFLSADEPNNDTAVNRDQIHGIIFTKDS